jgi:predicted phosphodiesterase
MRYLVVSDLHANFPAVEAVRKKSGKKGIDYDASICLGDLVGYYPFPNETISFVKDNYDYCIKGNHDENVCTGNVMGFNIYGSLMAKITTKLLNEDNKDFLLKLPSTYTLEDDIIAVHGSIKDKDKYLLNPYSIWKDMVALPSNINIVLFGHTHVRAVYPKLSFNKYSISSSEYDLSNGLFYINPGSVGQRRKSYPAPVGFGIASYGILDVMSDGTTRFSFHDAEYKLEDITKEFDRINHLLDREVSKITEISGTTFLLTNADDLVSMFVERLQKGR